MDAILFSTAHVPWPYLRQTMHGDGRHVARRFACNPGSIEHGDALIVFDEPHARLATRIPLQRRLLFIGEPPSVKVYRPDYLNQFGTVVCPYPLPGYTGNRLVSHSALPWHFGVDRESPDNQRALSWRELSSMRPPPKTSLLSVICSDKASTEGHRARLEFLERLKGRFPESLEIFGRGFAPVADKAEALLPYRYHLVLENNDEPGFWTEKLADALLGFCFPIFSGCSNIHEYFAESSLACIDIRKPEQALERIADILEHDDYEARLEHIVLARTKVLTEHNLFSIAETWRANLAEGRESPFAKVLEPNTVAANPRTLWRRLLSRLCGAIKRRLSNN
ncbi:MAG: hypothetical protein FWF99_01630 [Desulfovibrionaceae bacterium]|nr:hypothetical protein [Desulfovibrionaceae bacterium]